MQRLCSDIAARRRGINAAAREAPACLARCILAGCVAAMLLVAGCAHAAVVPLIHAHAHNDYQHARPLAEALECGFCSIEADVHLVNGQLLVAHDLKQTRPGRTLRSLYLDPLLRQVREHGGRVYPGGPTVTLLVDIKSKPQPTYAALREILQEYASMLTHFDHGQTQPGAVAVVLTGGVPRAMVAADVVRLVACDGTLADLDTDPSAELVPQINGKWSDHFQWRGIGPMPADQRQRLLALVVKAHQQHRRIRFWDAPDNEAAWRELRADGVDLINTDRLSACRDFLLNAEALPKTPPATP